MASQTALRELNTSPRAVRSPSFSSEVLSTRSGATAAVPEANPPPAFVASTEASQLVSSEVDDIVHVKEQALFLLNSFLDHILYNILSAAKSIQLGSLRDAVPVVLKPRLGKAALAAADEELKEYLSDGDDDMVAGSDPRIELRYNFDVDLAWKLARLRCMVYTRLGDMEEEDEEDYIESEQLHRGSGSYTNAAHRASSVQAASAIFLTSILEYLGEQALLYAVQNTQRRAQKPKSPVALQLNENGPMSPPIHQSMVLDESDMFYVGRESPLSRLWRSWRRQTRSPMETVSRQISPMQDEHPHMAERSSRIDENASQEETQGFSLPHQVPLPTSDNDVNEIEVPGLAREIVDDEDAQPVIPVPERSKKRPVSMVINTSDVAHQLSPESPRTLTVRERRRSRPHLDRKRSMSHPTPVKQTYSTMSNTGLRDVGSPEKAQEAEDRTFQSSTSAPPADAVPAAFAEQPSGKQEPEEGRSGAGIAVTAVSAAAGALGLSALVSATKSKDHESAEPQTNAARTVADEMIGTTPQVAQPKDAVTGSSITSVGDFDKLHIPVEKISGKPKPVSRPVSSDPEDLALSSGDEDASQKTPGIPAKANDQQEMIVPMSKEGPNGDAPVTNHEEPERPSNGSTGNSMIPGASSNRHIAAMPIISSPSGPETAINRNVAPLVIAQPEKGITRESVASRPSTATTTIHSSVPARMSSDRSGSRHAHTDSRTSRYSQDSKRSSSSSKLLGFTRDHEGRPQTATSKGPVTNSIDEAEAKKKSLEILIRGDETLHYTLTPVSARGENFPLPGHSPHTSVNSSSRERSKAIRNSTASTTSGSINGLRANPVNEMASSPASRIRSAASDSAARGITALASTQAGSRNNRIQPRDARLDNTTMMDLADYARSTGPENAQQLPKALSSRPGTATTVKTMKSSSTVRTTPAPPIPTIRPTTLQSPSSKSLGARTRFQAREPIVARSSGTNDLVQFLREGPPPSAGGANGHLSNGNGRASAASTLNSSVTPRSVQESMNSSTALLTSNRAQQKNVNGATPSNSGAARRVSPPQQDAMPARKQRRVRDPYAIDDSDDDLDEQQNPPQAHRTQDESLIDFLRNTAPPPGSSAPPILAASSARPSNAAAGAVKRQPSNQGIRERIMRSASRTSLNRKASVNHSQPARSVDEPPRAYRSAGHAREESPHLSQMGKKIDSYKPTSVHQPRQAERNRVQKVARQPTRNGQSDTAELAAYLRNSGPPDTPGRPMQQASLVREESGFLKFFSRRKAMN